MAYVNFETEEAALAAFELNTKNPMSKIKVAYYEKGSSGQVAFTQAVEDVRGNTNYRVLFVRKINKRVSFTRLECQIFRRKFLIDHSNKISVNWKKGVFSCFNVKKSELMSNTFALLIRSHKSS